MEGFKTLFDAVEYASDICSIWRSPFDGECFTYKEMMGVAAVTEAVAPLEEPFWYVVFDDGGIDYMCTETKNIDQMFIAANDIPVPQSERIDFMNEDSIPDDLITDVKPSAEEPAKRFCKHCGAKIDADSKFCPSCGGKL